MGGGLQGFVPLVAAEIGGPDHTDVSIAPGFGGYIFYSVIPVLALRPPWGKITLRRKSPSGILNNHGIPGKGRFNRGQKVTGCGTALIIGCSNDDSRVFFMIIRSVNIGPQGDIVSHFHGYISFNTNGLAHHSSLV